jgi:hypothetical protein
LDHGSVGVVLFFWTDDWRYEAVSLARHRLNEPRHVGVILQDLPELADCAPDAVVGVEEDTLAPDLSDNFVSSDDLTLVLEQQYQDLQRDTFQFQPMTVAAQAVGSDVKLKVFAEPDRFLHSDRLKGHWNTWREVQRFYTNFGAIA